MLKYIPWIARPAPLPHVEREEPALFTVAESSHLYQVLFADGSDFVNVDFRPLLYAEVAAHCKDKPQRLLAQRHDSFVVLSHSPQPEPTDIADSMVLPEKVKTNNYVVKKVYKDADKLKGRKRNPIR